MLDKLEKKRKKETITICLFQLKLYFYHMNMHKVEKSSESTGENRISQILVALLLASGVMVHFNVLQNHKQWRNDKSIKISIA